MDVLGAADQVLLNLARTQSARLEHARALGSGLRINIASDDPSGLAIAERLHTQVLGFQESVANVQTANNLLRVAEGVLATVQRILQRINILGVQAHSVINSDRQLIAIQTEIDQLLKELNAISSKASFNGITLFNGSIDNRQVIPPSKKAVDAESRWFGASDQRVRRHRQRVTKLRAAHLKCERANGGSPVLF